MRQPRERRWDETDLLAIYIDGQRFGDHHAISAVGIDRDGVKHVLGIESGARKMRPRVKKVLVALRDQGLRTDQQYLFVINGAKALRAAIKEVFGTGQPVQRCRNHNMRNVLDELPREQHAQALKLIRAAWKLTDADEGVKRLELKLSPSLYRSWERPMSSGAGGAACWDTLCVIFVPA